MAHFAKLDENNVVLSIHRVQDDIATDETTGINYLKNLYKWENWKQCSYNTFGGVHKLGGTPLRKNFPGINFTYDPNRDAFLYPKPYPSWTLNETSCLWEAPSRSPQDGKVYLWNESTTSWEEQVDSGE
jgi:hypothetical protein